jgi:plasmid stabilization system protein ParE
MSGTATVFVTRGFERHLDRIERFLVDAGVPEHFDTLLDALQNAVIPNLERHPDMSRDFLARGARSVEAESRLERLVHRLGELDHSGSIREYVMAQHLLLYAHLGDAVHLLAIRHQRELCFDLGTADNT